MPKGILYLIPVPLAEDSVSRVLPADQLNLINSIKTYIAENSKTARHWLKAMELQIPQSELTIHVYGKHAEKVDLSSYFKELENGQHVGLMSEAGCPAIADPGSDLVAEAHRRGIRVCPLVGPSSILLALMGSGFNGQNFAFHGYLPIDKEERSKRIKELEAASERNNQSQIFIETPFRNNPLLEEIVRSCNAQTRLCVGVNLTGTNEQVISASISEWKQKRLDLHKQPAIFILYRKR